MNEDKNRFKLEWDEKYSWGIQEIDDQHKEVINAVNELYVACKDNTIKENIIDLIEKLDYYISIHFKTEEKYAIVYGFKKIEQLLSEHKFFIGIYTEIKNIYKDYSLLNNSSDSQYKHVYIFAVHLNQTLIGWLNVHLNTIDKELGEFLKGKI